jgi:hypothetical protein
MRKRTTGSFDQERARRAAQARWARKSHSDGPDGTPDRSAKESVRGGGLEPDNPDLNLADLPRETLIELLKDPKTAGYVRVRAAEALHRIEPEPSRTQDYRQSAQIRDDFTPPTWEEVLAVARQSGAIE